MVHRNRKFLRNIVIDDKSIQIIKRDHTKKKTLLKLGVICYARNLQKDIVRKIFILNGKKFTWEYYFDIMERLWD